MKLSEALKVTQVSRNAPALPVALVCGFTPLHLETFLKAQLCLLFPDRTPELRTGLFGDLLGNFERLKDVSAAAVVVEWSDLDPRLGLRSLGGWRPTQVGDILENAKGQCERIAEAIRAAADSVPVAVCFPTLPLPPISFTHGNRASELVLELRSRVGALSASVARFQNVRVVDPQRVEEFSVSERLDVKSDLVTGFPYSLRHASYIAELLAWLMRNPLPKKGLITDLDDTLWKGILGEVGIEGIAWDLDAHAQIHGLYQLLLSSLAAAGTLIAVASKNDADLVQETFTRRKPILSQDRIYPFEVHWGPKSASVSRILQAWNISADQVVFVDDSSMDLAEVKSVHPKIECLCFPSDDYRAAYELLVNLRDLFGKERISQEDSLRIESLRSQAAQQKFQEERGSSSVFQQELGARLSLSLQKLPIDPRNFELVNKTNQFNLNGRRYQETEWRNWLTRPDTVLLTVNYTDKFGPLGKIAVLGGTLQTSNGLGGRFCVQTWAMSCRAFSRLIEYACLDYLFRKLEIEEIEFDFFSTQRNGPIRDFLTRFQNGDLSAAMLISRQTFIKQCPPLKHTVEELPNG